MATKETLMEERLERITNELLNLDVSCLHALTPSIIQRQATINIGN